MASIFLAVLMGATPAGGDQEDFNQAYQRSLVSGRPLVVLIGAPWCRACQTMKHSILPRIAGVGGLNRVVFTYVDFDQQRELAARLSRATSIPQLIRFDRTPAGWNSRHLVGAKSPREVYDFINAGLNDKDRSSKITVIDRRPQYGPRRPTAGEQ
jgi:thiol-disulfide isomerase/thioredoxin